MAHPMQEHRGHKVERERVSHIAGISESPKHYARGGSVHSDEAEDFNDPYWRAHFNPRVIQILENNDVKKEK